MIVQNFKKNQFSTIFTKTPAVLKEVFFSEKTSTFIEDISERYKIKNIGMLTDIISEILLGLLPTRKLIKTFQEELSLDYETAKKIAYEIREKVLGPVARELAMLQIQHKTRINPNVQGSISNETLNPKSQTPSWGDESLARQKLTNWKLIEELKAEQNKASDDVGIEPPEYPPPLNLPTQQEKDIHPAEEYAGQNKRTIPLTNTVDLRQNPK